MIDWDRAKQVQWGHVLFALFGLVVVTTMDDTVLVLIWTVLLAITPIAILKNGSHIERMEGYNARLAELQVQTLEGQNSPS